jgi:hypothetical protein
MTITYRSEHHVVCLSAALCERLSSLRYRTVYVDLWLSEEETTKGEKANVRREREEKKIKMEEKYVVKKKRMRW